MKNIWEDAEVRESYSDSFLLHSHQSSLLFTRYAEVECVRMVDLKEASSCKTMSKGVG